MAKSDVVYELCQPSPSPAVSHWILYIKVNLQPILNLVKKIENRKSFLKQSPQDTHYLLYKSEGHSLCLPLILAVLCYWGLEFPDFMDKLQLLAVPLDSEIVVQIVKVMDSQAPVTKQNYIRGASEH